MLAMQQQQHQQEFLQMRQHQQAREAVQQQAFSQQVESMMPDRSTDRLIPTLEGMNGYLKVLAEGKKEVAKKATLKDVTRGMKLVKRFEGGRLRAMVVERDGDSVWLAVVGDTEALYRLS
eukprot:TRINITY_DN24444_c0_g1_i1.p4 TRINITY_DN24444_c0_g1~~TRINITY_DN24444_c0_g1_i1.p4  ORF type:complete len:120 (+),score=25.51 TRINITY_DN24444_c0_g1_i1:76-435(+)